MTEELTAATWLESKNYRRAVELGSQAVDSLVEVLLGYGIPQADRIHAAEALGEIGDRRALPALVEALTRFLDVQTRVDTNMEMEIEMGRSNPVGKAAIQALAEYWDPGLIRPLLLAARETRLHITETAEVITGLGVQAVPVLVALLDDPEFRDVKDPNPITLLGAIGDPAAIEPLIAVLKSRWPASTCLEALARIKHPATFDALQPFVGLQGARAISNGQNRHEDPRNIRNGVIECLADLGDPRARDVLAGELLNVNIPLAENWHIPAALDRLGWKPGADPAGVRYWLLKGELDKIAAIPAVSFDTLLSILPRKDEDEDVLTRVVKALGEIGDPRAIKPLQEMILARLSEKFRPEFYLETMQICSRVIRPRVELFVETLLAIPNPSVQDIVAHADLLLSEYVSLLEAVKKSPLMDARVRSEAARHLENYKESIGRVPLLDFGSSN